MPLAPPAPEARGVGRAYQHVRGWRDERWEWTLAVDEPFTDEDLARVIALVPPG